MQHSVADLLGTSLVPELCPDITAGSSCHEEGILVSVTTVRAFPYQLSCLICHDLDLPVIAAGLAVIALGIELCIGDIVIDKAHDRKHSLNIILQIGNLHIADSSAGRKLLEF